MVQFMAAFIVAMSPSFILQSNSTQNDLLSALWVSMIAYWALAQWACPAAGRYRVVGFGLALGLALGTKGTSLVIALPWVIAFLVADLRAVGLRAFCGPSLGNRCAGRWVERRSLDAECRGLRHSPRTSQRTSLAQTRINRAGRGRFQPDHQLVVAFGIAVGTVQRRTRARHLVAAFACSCRY